MDNGDVNKTKTKRVGTAGFLAPEVFSSSKYDVTFTHMDVLHIVFCVLELKISVFPLDSVGMEKPPSLNQKPEFSQQIANEERTMVEQIKKCLENEPDRRP